MKIVNYVGTCCAPCSEPDALKAMLRYASEAAQFAAGRSRAALDADRQLNLALVRLLECVGEASVETSEFLRCQYSDIAWTRIQGWSRQFLEQYDSIDFDIIWEIIQIDLPPLIAQLSCIVGDGLAQGITESLIQTHPHPSSPACVYSWEYFLEYDAEGLTYLPIGLQKLVAIQDLDGGIGNGGFRGHLGNRTDDTTDTLEESIAASLEALRAFGLTEPLDIATTAINEWLARMPAWRAADQHGQEPDIDAFQEFCEPLDRRWYEQQDAMYTTIDSYMKAHPEQFIHP